MIHSKSLIRRLAYVPWLLAFGLVLGWAGEAQAQITLTLDKKSIREEAGATTITVTAKATADIADATAVQLDWGETPIATTTAPDPATALTKDQFGNRKGVAATSTVDTEFDRYLITMTSIVFPKDTKKDATQTGTITFTPLDDDIFGNGGGATEANAEANNLRIWILGRAGTGVTVTGASFDLIDNDQLSSEITLSYGEKKIPQDADPTKVTVTATLNGKVLAKALEFTLLFDDDAPTEDRAVRDQDYRATGKKNNHPRRLGEGNDGR